MRIRILAILGMLFPVMPFCEGGTSYQSTPLMDWDRVLQAYHQADSIEDFENRVNLIYLGDEIISVGLSESDLNRQLVYGFVDTNANGMMEDTEKLFQIERDFRDNRVVPALIGYGAYSGVYRDREFEVDIDFDFKKPRFKKKKYTTSVSKKTNLYKTRQDYRAKNQDKFVKNGNTWRSKSTATSSSAKSKTSKSSQSGGSWGSKSGSSWGSSRSGSSYSSSRRSSSSSFGRRKKLQNGKKAPKRLLA